MTNTFILISCCAKKRESGNYAEVLYDSDVFKKRLAYARLLNPTGIDIISACEVFKPSENWLGKSSSITKIRGSGLWLVNELSL